MKKVKAILPIFFHSFIPQDKYYPKLLHTRFRFSVKYYSIVISFFALLFVGIVALQYTPSKLDGYRQSLVGALSGFPSDTLISLDRGVLESNKTMPLFFWIYDKDQPRFAFMVYTKDVPNISTIQLPLLFFGRDHMKFSYRGQSMTWPYDPKISTFVASSTVYKYITDVNAYFPSFLVGFYIFLILLLPIAYIGSSTLFILISSGIVYLLLRTFIPHIHFKKCLQAGMHGTHIPLLISILLCILFPASPNMGIISIALTFVFTLVATYEMYSKEVPHFKGR